MADLTLVTGATGFLGWHVARLLVERGHRVRALSRQDGPVPGLDVETVRGDLRDSESLERAVRGCRFLFHVAADYRLWVRDPHDMYRSNVEGTRQLLYSARAAGVEKVVYTSTVGCIGVPAGEWGDENQPTSLASMQGPYKRTKYLAELAVLELAREGVPVTIVNPTAPIGERDIKPTPTGKVILDFLKGKMPAFVDTGLNLVDVHDCARGHLQALERGRIGERYILGAENLDLGDILARLAALTNRKAPTIQIPHFVAYVAGVFSTAAARVTGGEPDVPLDAVRMARKKMFVRHDKAARELEYQPSGVDDALLRAANWFLEKGYAAG